MQIAKSKCKLQITKPSHVPDRRGGVYIAVLGTSLIVALLGLSALMSQRIQNRMLVASADIAQAKLNADSAVELGLLTCKQNNSWRSLRDGQSFLYTGRSTGDGTCSLKASDAPSDAADAADRPFHLIGIGYHGPDAGDAPRTAAEQRVELAVDPRRQSHDFLKQTSSATPDWPTILAYYQTNGTQITVSSLSDRTPAFSRNSSLDDGHAHWTLNFPDDYSDFREADDSAAGAYKGHSACLYVERDDWREGAANRLNATFLKPSTSYNVSIEINPDYGLLTIGQWTPFRITLLLEFQDGSTALSTNSISQTIAGSALGTSWTSVSGTLQTPNWSQHPTAVYLVVTSYNNGTTHKSFYLDNLDFYESGAPLYLSTSSRPRQKSVWSSGHEFKRTLLDRLPKHDQARHRTFADFRHAASHQSRRRFASGLWTVSLDARRCWLPCLVGEWQFHHSGNGRYGYSLAQNRKLRELQSIRSSAPHVRHRRLERWSCRRRSQRLRLRNPRPHRHLRQCDVSVLSADPRQSARRRERRRHASIRVPPRLPP